MSNRSLLRPCHDERDGSGIAWGPHLVYIPVDPGEGDGGCGVEVEAGAQGIDRRNVALCDEGEPVHHPLFKRRDLLKNLPAFLIFLRPCLDVNFPPAYPPS